VAAAVGAAVAAAVGALVAAVVGAEVGLLVGALVAGAAVEQAEITSIAATAAVVKLSHLGRWAMRFLLLFCFCIRTVPLGLLLQPITVVSVAPSLRDVRPTVSYRFAAG